MTSFDLKQMFCYNKIKSNMQTDELHVNRIVTLQTANIWSLNFSFPFETSKAD